MKEIYEFLDGMNAIPESDVFSMKDAITKSKLKELKESNDYHRMLDLYRNEYLEQITEIFGRKKYDEFKKFRDRRRRNLIAAVKKFSSTPEGMKEFEKLRIRGVHKSIVYLKKLNIDQNKIVMLNKRLVKQIDSLFLKTIGSGRDQTNDKINKKQKGPDPLFEPPYFLPTNFIETYSPSGDGWARIFQERNDRIGQFNDGIECRLFDCGEADVSSALLRQSWLFVFRVESSGRLNVRMTLHNIRTAYANRYNDENGWSGVDIKFQIRMFARRIFPVPETHRVYNNLAASDNMMFFPDYNYHDEGCCLESGGVTVPFVFEHEFQRSCLLNDTIDRDQWVIVEVGIEAFNRVWGDDCTVSSSVRYELEVPHVNITVVR